jgi:coenzyme F420-reducing hydrogenase delta subunit
MANLRFKILKEMLDFVGFNKGKLSIEWISASEGKKFADTIIQFAEDIKKCPPSNL